MKAKRKERAFYVHCGRISEAFSSLQGKAPERGPPQGAAAIFRGGAVCPLEADFVDAPCFFPLQVDEQLRLNYNFSPEVEFRAVRSLTLGKVTGLYYGHWALLKHMSESMIFIRIVSDSNLEPRFLELEKL